MKPLAGQIAQLSQDQIISLENQGSITLNILGEEVVLTSDEIEVVSEMNFSTFEKQNNDELKV